MDKKRKRLFESIEAELGSGMYQRRQTRQARHTVYSTDVVETSSILPSDNSHLRILQESRLLRESRAAEASGSSSQTPDLPEPAHSEKKKTQTSQHLQEFVEQFPRLLHMLFDHEADNSVGLPCPCGNGIKTTRCYDCAFYEITCTHCYISAHDKNPFHWAEVWDAEQGFFIRKDISALKPSGYTVQLGHQGKPCPSPSSSDLFFHIVHCNGIHNTKLRFCGCGKSPPSRVDQLMLARLFPASIQRPTMAFTFNLLQQFHLHHLESKESAYDFIGALRRQTDNMFAHNVSDPYPQFRLVMRIWRLLISTKRSGQAHGIDTILNHRPKGNLIVFCPACPELDVNMEENWQRTSPELRHLNQLQHTADGNHQCNKYAKNSDPDDVSLFSGRAYFPEHEEYQKYLQSLSPTSEKSTCSFLNVVNKQDRKKFKNMDITGVVNVQCNHVLVKSTVDMQLGERFGNVDYGVARVVRQCQILCHKPRCGHVFSYDCNCIYCAHIVDRFKLQFPDLVPAIQEMRFLIPLLHVQGHKENCIYSFSSAYTENAGHFHGETAEHYWAELNQIGAQTRQMNNGHRQDTIIDHHSDWNWKKVANMGAALYNDIQHAKQLFSLKRDHFIGLSNVYAKRIPFWNQEDRSRRFKNADKEIECVYRHNKGKVPSQTALYHLMLKEESNKEKAPSYDSDTPGLSVAVFLNEGIQIESMQRKIKALRIRDNHATESGQKEIQDRQKALTSRLVKWRSAQKYHMTFVGTLIAERLVSGKGSDKPEDDLLFLPSDLLPSQRSTPIMLTLSDKERRLREGQAFDALRSVQTAVKMVVAFRDDKKKHARGQDQNTRANTKVRHAEGLRDIAMADYTAARMAMIALGLESTHINFPPLTLQDTYRRSTYVKRALGDSQRIDGPIWTMTGVTAGNKTPATYHQPSAPGDTTMMPLIGTQGSKATKRIVKPTLFKKKGSQQQIHHNTGASHTESLNQLQVASRSLEKESEDGWLWRLGAMGNLSEKELEDWAEEGDRVQWFRAEAEMQRWQEEWEIKQAEFCRCIRAFLKMSNVWMELSKFSVAAGAGHIAYARQRSVMYAKMAHDAKQKFIAAGYAHRLEIGAEETLSEHIAVDRKDPTAALHRVLANQGILEENTVLRPVAPGV